MGSRTMKNKMKQAFQHSRQIHVQKRVEKSKKNVKITVILPANSQMSYLIVKEIPLKNEMFCRNWRKALPAFNTKRGTAFP